MNNTEVLNEFFIWEEKNLTEPKMKLENKTESEQKDSMINTTTVNEYENWKTITNPKLRKKMRKKAWRKSNKNKIKLSDKAYREVNRDKVLLKKKAYYESNKDKIKIQMKIYRESNKNKINSYFRNKTKTDIQYKLRRNLRCRLRSAINNNQKVGSAVKDLGCTIDDLKTYLESKFQSGMTWDNWTSDGWHIDHIKPLSSFDLTDRHQFLEACHYTNLQPLWAKDNLLKSDTVA